MLDILDVLDSLSTSQTSTEKLVHSGACTDVASASERMVRYMVQKLFCHAPTTLSDVLTESVQGPEYNSFAVNARYAQYELMF